MLNQVVMVGRLVSDPEVVKEGEKELSTITLAIPRSFKNSEGVYETDFIECILYNQIATNTTEYCKKGDIIGVKGRLQSQEVEDKRITQIIAEKVTFLSSKSE